MDPIIITNKSGYIVDRAVREAYDRISEANRMAHNGNASAEAFLRLVERYAARGIRLIPAKEEDRQ